MPICRQKLLICLIISLMAAPLSPSSAIASTQAAIPLDQAIQTVKQNFNVPAEYTKFSSGLNDLNDRQAWSLSWNNPSEKGGHFNAQVDTKTREIISMNNWNPDKQKQSQVPSLSPSQAQEIGTQLLQRLIPERISSLQFIPEQPIIPLGNYGEPSYSLRWQRLANDIPVLGEGASIEISLADGQALGYNLNWTNMDMPDPAGVITPDAARQTFIQEEILQLQYILPTGVQPLSLQSKPSPILVYRLDHPSNGIIDALTGEVILPEYDQLFSGGAGDANIAALGSKQANRDEAAAVPLTPQEIEEINKTYQLISQDEAISALKQWLDIPENLTLSSANLGQDWRDSDLRSWNLNWQSVTTPKEGQPRSLYGRINAQTGELMSFNLDLTNKSDSKPDMTQAAAQTLADNFLKKVQPQRFAELKLNEHNLDRDKRSAVSHNPAVYTWQFNYIRMVNGISFPGNGADIQVDRSNQKIIAYNLNWANQEFPSDQGVLGVDRANEQYLQALPLTLSYSKLNNSAGIPLEMRLTYQPQNPPSQPYISYIDAKTGESLDYQGKPISSRIRARYFNDIAGNFAAKEISLLGQAGLFSEYDNDFHPDEEIKLASLMRAMLTADNGFDYTVKLSDQEIMQRAWALDWTKENLAADSSVSQGLLAQLMIRWLDLEYLATKTEIFQVPFPDAFALSDDLKGYVALSWGLGLIKGTDDSFDASHRVSRAEAAFALVQTLNVKTQS